MQTDNTPISVWHGQPFELPVLDTDGRWALVRYRNPKEKPQHFSLLRNLFVVRNGQSFSAVGNVDCTVLKVWKMTGLFSWPRKCTIQLAVRRLDKKPMPVVYTPTPEPRINTSVIVTSDFQPSVIKDSQVQFAPITMKSMPAFNLQPINFQLTSPTDEPELKGFDDET
jgi:hypothetical protein